MGEYFVGEIRMFSWDWPPKTWALCNGALLSVSQNQALFALIGTYYGGDGVTTFALPDLRGRVIAGVGQQPGGSSYPIGMVAGSESVTLTTGQLPEHSHAVTASTAKASVVALPGNYFGIAQTTPAGTQSVQTYAATATNGVTLAPGTVSPNGGGQPHANIQPYLANNYCIALVGIFPSRN